MTRLFARWRYCNEVWCINVCSAYLLTDRVICRLAGVGVCTFAQGDRQDGSCCEGHVSGEGHSGTVPQRRICVHGGAASRGGSSEGQ